MASSSDDGGHQRGRTGTIVLGAARGAKLDLDQPFPFLITRRVERVAFHVLDKRDGLPHNAELHERAKAKSTLPDTRLDIVGFYSNTHRACSCRPVGRCTCTSGRWIDGCPCTSTTFGSWRRCCCFPGPPEPGR
jgi:hypothetical protein